jgi:hypothetical protein
MALRVARGLFRLWLVLSVLWVALLGVRLWNEWPEPYLLECQGVGTISECMDKLEKAGKNPFGHDFEHLWLCVAVREGIAFMPDIFRDDFRKSFCRAPGRFHFSGWGFVVAASASLHCRSGFDLGLQRLSVDT